MIKALQQRSRAVIILILCYLAPLCLLATVSSPGWGRWTLGLLLMTGAVTALYMTLRAWEETLPAQIPAPAVVLPTLAPAETGSDVQSLQERIQSLEKQSEELAQQLQTDLKTIKQLQNDKSELVQRCEDLQQSLSSHLDVADDQLSSKNTLLEEYQQTIADQRQVIEKKHKLITALESKVNDLKYELKTLLDLTDRIDTDAEESTAFQEVAKPSRTIVTTVMPKKTSKASVAEHPSLPGLLTESRPQTPVDAIQQLKRCIDIAQKLTGARHLAGDSSRFRDLSVDGYALDLRRLCDSLRSETSGMIILYSQKEDRLLFVNNQVRDILGWSADKFVQNFQALSVDGLTEWKRGLLRLSAIPQVDFPLTLKTRSGEERTIHCHLGTIPTGIFKTHVVGVMY